MSDCARCKELEARVEQLLGKVARLEKEKYKLQIRVHEQDGLELAMARHGYGTVNKIPKHRT